MKQDWEVNGKRNYRLHFWGFTSAETWKGLKQIKIVYINDLNWQHRFKN